VFVETVGVGQAEIDIIDHADTIVLVLMPGSGDSIQALKAGVMEIPDVIVINKADHPLTDTMVREIRGVLSLANLDRSPEQARAIWRVPIVKTEANRGTGVEELVERLEEHRAHILEEGQLAERRSRNLRNEVLAIAAARMRRRLEDDLGEDAEFQRLLDAVVQRELDPASAASALLERGSPLERALE
jgi:LAO/AO transport system kinase